MARPKTDVAAVRRTLLEATEALLRRDGALKVTMSDVAAECGMSQSNAYRFFASRQALLEAAGQRWFEEIENELDKVARSSEPPDRQFIRFVVKQYEMKRARYEADPALFAAYVELGLANMAIVERHLARIAAPLGAIMHRLGQAGRLGGRTPSQAAALAEAMTVRFRDPVQIMRFAVVDNRDRAAEAAAIILAGLALVSGSSKSNPSPP